MVPMRLRTSGVCALHEPHPLTPSLSPSGGEGARRMGEVPGYRFIDAAFRRFHGLCCSGSGGDPDGTKYRKAVPTAPGAAPIQSHALRLRSVDRVSFGSRFGTALEFHLPGT